MHTSVDRLSRPDALPMPPRALQRAARGRSARPAAAHRRRTAPSRRGLRARCTGRNLPLPPALPGRHPPQRQDRARKTGRVGGKATAEQSMKILVTGGGGLDRKSVVEGKRVSVRVDLGGRRIVKKKKKAN